MSLQTVSAMPNQVVVPSQNQPPQPPPQTPPQPPPVDNEPHDITMHQLVDGLGGALAGAAIETVGNTGSALLSLIKPTSDNAIYRAGKAIWKTPMIGPVLKTSISILLPVAVVATPVLTALGSLGVGMFRGAAEGAEHGFKAAIKETAGDVKRFHKEIAPKVPEFLQEIETMELPPGQKPYDIRVIEAGKGLVSAVPGALIEGIGVGGITIGRTPKGVYRAFQGLNSADVGPILKNLGRALVIPAAAVVVGFAPVGAAVYGVYKGFGDGYRDGIIKSVENRVDDVKQWNKWTKEALEHEWK